MEIRYAKAHAGNCEFFFWVTLLVVFMRALIRSMPLLMLEKGELSEITVA